MCRNYFKLEWKYFSFSCSASIPLVFAITNLVVATVFFMLSYDYKDHWKYCAGLTIFSDHFEICAFFLCDRRQVIECEALLVATGRKPNVNKVGLEKAGVEFNAKDGVKVNDQLQTTNKVSYAPQGD